MRQKVRSGLARDQYCSNKIKRRTHFGLQQAHSNLRGAGPISISREGAERDVARFVGARARRDALRGARAAAARCSQSAL